MTIKNRLANLEKQSAAGDRITWKRFVEIDRMDAKQWEQLKRDNPDHARQYAAVIEAAQVGSHEQP
jgi:hypothetical protein